MNVSVKAHITESLGTYQSKFAKKATSVRLFRFMDKDATLPSNIAEILNELLALNDVGNVGKVISLFTRIRKAYVDNIADLSVKIYYTIGV